jgi:hypothetical protein
MTKTPNFTLGLTTGAAMKCGYHRAPLIQYEENLL